MIKVLLTGSKGMLAQAFLKLRPSGWNIMATDIEELDITQISGVEKTIRAFQPGIIINCAAYTRVDDCEREKESCFKINAVGPDNLAFSAHRIGAKLVHFSTDYVYDGNKKSPYSEDDLPHPINNYGMSKLKGEEEIRKRMDDFLIIRTQWLFGHGGNHFVKTILKLAEDHDSLKVVNDQIGSPTFTEDMAEATIELIEMAQKGTFHVVNSGECSWYDFASMIIKMTGLKTKIDPCLTSEFPRPAKRPAYSVLSTQKVVSVLGRPLPDWEIGLKYFLTGKRSL